MLLLHQRMDNFEQNHARDMAAMREEMQNLKDGNGWSLDARAITRFLAWFVGIAIGIAAIVDAVRRGL